MHFPDRPSTSRRLLLAPASALYCAGSMLHRLILSRRRTGDHAHLPPLFVIGSLRAGGAGKTPVARELARHLSAKGLRVGVLAYALNVRVSGACKEVFPDTDWRTASDEAVLRARGLESDFPPARARVFVTRDRERAWQSLARTGAFDVLVSDDGLSDPRLRGAFRVCIGVALTAGEDRQGRPRWTDLLPAGPYRLTAAVLDGMDAVLQEGAGFTRETIPPENWNPQRPGWLLCGMGNPEAFLQSLKNAGIRVVGSSAGPDHGLPGVPCAVKRARQEGVDAFLCSEKDAVKLESHPQGPPKLFRVGERVTLSSEFLASVDAFIDRSTS
jgi:tetraacyldisaccharide 4'-kinase